MRFIHIYACILLVNSKQNGVVALTSLYGDPNAVCTRYESYTASKYVPYKETYIEKELGIFNQTNFRWNYKIEYYQAYRPVYECCENYTEVKDICRANCDPDCGKGYCIRPNVCFCHPGYHQASGYDTVCVAVCENDCVHGTCTAPGTCTCQPAYWLEEDGFTCRPACELDCEQFHATCTAPNVCTCASGYQQSENASLLCEPVCEPACVNGYCVRPNECEYKQIYRNKRQNDSTVCGAACGGNPINETTGSSEPLNVVANDSRCIQEDAYRLTQNGTCLPYCETCSNGTCVAPNVCECHAGYRKIQNATGADCEISCRDGCNKHGLCIDDVGTCQCHYGFTGEDCSEPTVCILLLGKEYNTHLMRLIDRPNKTVNDLIGEAPICMDCLSEVNTETPCFFVTFSGIRSTIVVCLLSVELDCYTSDVEYDVKHEVVKVSLVVISIVASIILITMMMAYCVKRKNRKKDMIIGLGQMRKCKMLQSSIQEEMDVL